MPYVIIKSYNNNVILCNDSSSENECILVGKGIGFNAKEGQTLLNIKNIEKVFYLGDIGETEKLKNIFAQKDTKHLGIITEAITLISKEFNIEIKDKNYFSIVDHLVFAIQRHKAGINIENQFKSELKVLYNTEWKIAEKVISLINDKLKIKMPEDEVAFTTMHINGIIEKTKATDSVKNAMIVKDLISFIEDQTLIEIDKESLYYSRLVTHLKLALSRAVSGVNYTNVLLESIQNQLREAYQLAKNLERYVELKHNIKLSEDEVGFLALHLDRIITKKQN